MGYDFESSATIVTLLALIVVYLYILLSPTQPHVPDHKRNFVIPVDTLENFKAFTKGDSYGSFNGWDYTDDRKSNNSYLGGREKSTDDFFLFEGGGGESTFEDPDTPREPIVPSENYHCGSDWIMIRSQLNYKFLWMHTANFWMAAGATIDTPMHHKAFKLSPVNEDCSSGWVVLQEGDSSGFIYMVPQNGSAEGYGPDEWVIKTGTEDLQRARNNTAYHFLIESEGFVLNRRSMAFLNVISNADYAVRGHSSGWGASHLAAQRDYGATMQIEFVNASIVEAAIVKEDQEEKDAIEQDRKFVTQIQALPTFTEKRVISFGLYGKNPKYTVGAIHNMEAAKIYFPGWVCRFYVTADVPEEIVTKLKALGAEIVDIPPGKGYISGMFWRFLVAADPTVDRYIIRDSDSRMNARDRLAVEEWIESKYAIHILRDHVNHCLVMNGGMWGGVKGALSDMKELVEDWESRDEYAADLNFLEQKIWPKIKHSQIAHDSYCCDRFPNARPFPSKRPMTYQHVGQVFDEHDHPRLNDIDGYIRGVPVPGSCRKVADWIYG